MQDFVHKRATPTIRKQVRLTKEQAKRLKALAKSRSCSEGDIFRQALDEWLIKNPPEEIDPDWKKGLMSIAGMWADYPELDEIMAERRKHRAERRDKMNRKMRGEE